MARPLRIEFAEGCYHVINRGTAGVIAGGGAAEALERVLGEVAQRYRLRIHAYVIMSNHFHLAMELTEPNLSEGMKWLQGHGFGVTTCFAESWAGRFKGGTRHYRRSRACVRPGLSLYSFESGAGPAGGAECSRELSLGQFAQASENRPDWLIADTVRPAAGKATFTIWSFLRLTKRRRRNWLPASSAAAGA